MSDDVRIGRSNTFVVSVMALGLMSASFYLSIVLAFAFLLPLQLAFGRLGRQGGIRTALLASLSIAVVQLWRVLPQGGTGVLLASLAGIGYPLLLIGAIVILNARFWHKTSAPIKTLAVSLLVSALIAPIVALVMDDNALRVGLTEAVAKLISGFTSSPVTGTSGVPEGYDAAALLASLDPADMVTTTMTVFASSFAALLFLLIGGSWWAGNRMAGEGSSGRRESPALVELRLPEGLVWPFLLSWALLLAILYIRPGKLYEELAWNLSLIFSLAYAAQGSGIVAHYLALWKVPRFFRIALAVSLVVALMSSPLGTALVAILPLLGVTELWIPYRNPKGAGV